MKITIDTKEDSHEEIRKIIKMLSSLVGERSYSNQPNIFDNDRPSLGDNTPSDSGNAFANMFGSGPSNLSDENKDDDVKVEESEEIPEVIEYH